MKCLSKSVPALILGKKDINSNQTRDKVPALTRHVTEGGGATINSGHLHSCGALQSAFRSIGSFDFYNNVLQTRKQKLNDFKCLPQNRAGSHTHGAVF